MRAVWSFWSKPYAASTGLRWQGERFHLFAWVLSLMQARKFYPQTMLVTDTPGKALLVDRLGLPFERVSTALDALAEKPAQFWVLGKLYAYRLQEEPFFHIDTDVFLWKALPAELTGADFFAQNPEVFDLALPSCYRPDDFNRALELTGGWRPAAWTWALENRASFAVNCGVVGGARFDFLHAYAADAIRLIEDPVNQAAWQILGDLRSDNVVFEQYMLGACLEYARHSGSAPVSRFLFHSLDEAFNEDCARERGFTHLLGEAKSQPELLERIEARVKRDYPEYYARCTSVLASWKGW